MTVGERVSVGGRAVRVGPAVRVGRSVAVGMTEGENEGATEDTNVAEGDTGEAEGARVAVGWRVMVLPHPIRNMPTAIRAKVERNIL